MSAPQLRLVRSAAATAAAALAVAVIFAAAMVLGACGGSSASSDASPGAGPSAHASIDYSSFRDTPIPTLPAAAGHTGSPREAAAVADSVGDFGLALLARQAARTDGNVVLSPFSIAAALTMTLNGAQGETAAQMRSALCAAGIDPAQYNQGWADLIAAVNGDKEAVLRVADSLWLRNGVPFRPAFLQTDRDYFAADARELPADLAQGAQQINDWVDQRTGGRIKDLIGALEPATVMVLVNTVYVKAGWEAFDPAATEPQSFTLGDGTKAEVPTMQGHCGAGVSADGYSAVKIAANGLVNLWVVVPKGDETPESVLAMLQQKGLEGLQRDVRLMQVTVSLPRVHAEYSTEGLKDDLTAMGMSRAFAADTAEFGAMADLKPLWIDDVLHKAMLDVNEKGVEAAAGTAVVMCGAGIPTKELVVRADRPFVVLLTAGIYPEAPLFMGIIRDPR